MIITMMMMVIIIMMMMVMVIMMMVKTMRVLFNRAGDLQMGDDRPRSRSVLETGWFESVSICFLFEREGLKKIAPFFSSDSESDFF